MPGNETERMGNRVVIQLEASVGGKNTLPASKKNILIAKRNTNLIPQKRVFLP